jgi:hypothetical protein
LCQGPVEKVWFTEKDVLDYVLSYIGLGRAAYSNEPGQDAVYTGEVKIWLPDIESARCGEHFAATTTSLQKKLRRMQQVLILTPYWCFDFIDSTC